MLVILSKYKSVCDANIESLLFSFLNKQIKKKQSNLVELLCESLLWESRVG